VAFAILAGCATTSFLNAHRLQAASKWKEEAGRLKVGQSKADVEAAMEDEPFSRHSVHYMNIEFPRTSSSKLEGLVLSQLYWQDDGGHLLRWRLWDIWDCFRHALDSDKSIVAQEDKRALESYRAPPSYLTYNRGYIQDGQIRIQIVSDLMNIGDRSEMRNVDVTVLVYNYGGAQLRVALLFVNDKLLDTACPIWVPEPGVDIVRPVAPTTVGQ
jgi:hypothetical protein